MKVFVRLNNGQFFQDPTNESNLLKGEKAVGEVVRTPYVNQAIKSEGLTVLNSDNKDVVAYLKAKKEKAEAAEKAAQVSEEDLNEISELTGKVETLKTEKKEAIEAKETAETNLKVANENLATEKGKVTEANNTANAATEKLNAIVKLVKEGKDLKALQGAVDLEIKKEGK